MESLKKLGFLIEMDDFGSGYSSLNMLNQLSLDILKLDMQFIRSETTKPKSQGIPATYHGHRRDHGPARRGGGRGNKEQLERLNAKLAAIMGRVDYFAKAMPCEAFETLMRGPIELI